MKYESEKAAGGGGGGRRERERRGEEGQIQERQYERMCRNRPSPGNVACCRCLRSRVHTV